LDGEIGIPSELRHIDVSIFRKCDPSRAIKSCCEHVAKKVEKPSGGLVLASSGVLFSLFPPEGLDYER